MNTPNGPDARHSLLISHGAPARLLDAWERNLFTLVACDALIAELRDVAGRPFFKARLRASAAELLAAGLRDFSFFCQDLPSGPSASPMPAPRGWGRGWELGAGVTETTQIHYTHHTWRV